MEGQILCSSYLCVTLSQNIMKRRFNFPLAVRDFLGWLNWNLCGGGQGWYDMILENNINFYNFKVYRNDGNLNPKITSYQLKDTGKED